MTVKGRSPQHRCNRRRQNRAVLSGLLEAIDPAWTLTDNAPRIHDTRSLIARNLAATRTTKRIAAIGVILAVCYMWPIDRID
jgi:hypothetical protein